MSDLTARRPSAVAASSVRPPRTRPAARFVQHACVRRVARLRLSISSRWRSSRSSATPPKVRSSHRQSGSNAGIYISTTAAEAGPRRHPEDAAGVDRKPAALRFASALLCAFDPTRAGAPMPAPTAVPTSAEPISGSSPGAYGEAGAGADAAAGDGARARCRQPDTESAAEHWQKTENPGFHDPGWVTARRRRNYCWPDSLTAATCSIG